MVRQPPNSALLSAGPSTLGFPHRRCSQCGACLWRPRFFAPSISIEWTPYRQPAAIENMSVNHGRLHIFVPEEFLDGPDVIALLQQMRGKTVSEGMTTDAFVEPHRAPCLAHSLL